MQRAFLAAAAALILAAAPLAACSNGGGSSLLGVSSTQGGIGPDTGYGYNHP